LADKENGKNSNAAQFVIDREVEYRTILGDRAELGQEIVVKRTLVRQGAQGFQVLFDAIETQRCQFHRSRNTVAELKIGRHQEIEDEAEVQLRALAALDRVLQAFAFKSTAFFLAIIDFVRLRPSAMPSVRNSSRPCCRTALRLEYVPFLTSAFAKAAWASVSEIEVLAVIRIPVPIGTTE
jgi:hypothetical protein